MDPGPLDELLARLDDGDPTAAEQAFREYEPLLRVAVRRALPSRFRGRFDSIDIVQSVLAGVLRQFQQAGCRFTDPEHLRAFLLRAARNRLIDRLRQHDKTLRLEEPLADGEFEEAVASRLPRPSESLQADDLWQQLLSLCPPEHHEVLRLRREGHTFSEIAQQTGLHGDSVRRILRHLARRLAFESQDNRTAESS
jgi:RNA polymerase sigma-70 factor (ECF subfamily)